MPVLNDKWATETVNKCIHMYYAVYDPKKIISWKVGKMEGVILFMHQNHLMMRLGSYMDLKSAVEIEALLLAGEGRIMGIPVVLDDDAFASIRLVVSS